MMLYHFMHVLIDTVYGRKPITIYIIQLQEADKKVFHAYRWQLHLKKLDKKLIT